MVIFFNHLLEIIQNDFMKRLGIGFFPRHHFLSVDRGLCLDHDGHQVRRRCTGIDGQIDVIAGVHEVGPAVPGILQEIGDKILQVFFSLIRMQAFKKSREVLSELLNLITSDGLFRISLIEHLSRSFQVQSHVAMPFPFSLSGASPLT